eukprot:GABV01014877.1.p1 GENE.GABV01014877.1~~GABV01014877.1.p1  ORF type:complete len:122 (-),score=30.14 GABV01014877.1:3-368(-)
MLPQSKLPVIVATKPSFSEIYCAKHIEHDSTKEERLRLKHEREKQSNPLKRKFPAKGDDSRRLKRARTVPPPASPQPSPVPTAQPVDRDSVSVLSSEEDPNWSSSVASKAYNHLKEITLDA